MDRVASTDAPIRLAEAPQLRRWAIVGLALLGARIALGGPGANYAAARSPAAAGNPQVRGPVVAAARLPGASCCGARVGVDYEGGVLDVAADRGDSRVPGGVRAVVLRTPGGMRGFGSGLLLLALAQVALGIANVKLGLPLHMYGVLHNAGAATLLFVLVTCSRASARRWTDRRIAASLHAVLDADQAACVVALIVFTAFVGMFPRGARGCRR